MIILAIRSLVSFLRDVIRPALEAFKASIERDPKSIDDQDEDGNRALHYAVNANNRYMVEWLVSMGASTTVQNRKWESPLHTLIARAGFESEANKPQDVQAMLVAMVKHDGKSSGYDQRTTNLAFQLILDAAAEKGGGISTILPELRKDLSDLPQCEIVYNKAVKKALGQGSLNRLKNLRYSNERQPTGWQENADRISANPEAARLLADLLRRTYSAEGEGSSSPDYRENAGLLLRHLILERGPQDQVHGLTVPFEDAPLKSFIAELVNDPNKIELNNLVHTGLDSVLALSTLHADPDLVKLLVSKGAPITVDVKIAALGGQDPEVVSEIFSHPSQQGTAGDYVEGTHDDGSVDREEALGVLIEASGNPLVLDAYLKTRQRIVLPKSAKPFQANPANTPEMLRTIAATKKVDPAEFVILLDQLPKELLTTPDGSGKSFMGSVETDPALHEIKEQLRKGAAAPVHAQTPNGAEAAQTEAVRAEFEPPKDDLVSKGEPKATVKAEAPGVPAKGFSPTPKTLKGRRTNLMDPSTWYNWNLVSTKTQ